MAGNVCVRWLGQMGLEVRAGETAVMIDYYASEAPDRLIAPPIPAGEVKHVQGFLGTHDHLDHMDHEAWKIWAGPCPEAKFVFPEMHREAVLADGIGADRQLGLNAGGEVRVGEITVRAIPAAHEFLNPDAQGRYPALQYILEAEGKRIYHAGDTVRYEGMRPMLEAFGPIDLAIVPINGRDAARYRKDIIGNMTFQEAADLIGELNVRKVIPGHWNMFAFNPGDPAAFADYLDAKYLGRTVCLLPQMMEWVEL